MKDSYFDDLLNTKIGFGYYQYKLIGAILFVDFIDGLELALSTLYPQILEKEWDLVTYQIELAGAIFYFGQFIGFLICGYCADYFGRKKTLLTGSGFSLISFILMAYIQNYAQFLIIRFGYGLFFGVVIPAGWMLITENVPQTIRGRMMVLTQLTFVLGKVSCILLCFYFMESLTVGNWRGLTLSAAIPCFIMLISIIYLVEESPRYLIVNKKYRQAFKIMDKMGRDNFGNATYYHTQTGSHQNSIQTRSLQHVEDEVVRNNTVEYQQQQSEEYVPLTREQKKELKRWKVRFCSFQNTSNSFDKIKLLFQGLAKQISIRLLILNLLIYLLLYGVMFIQPFLYNSSGKGLEEYIWVYLSELPAAFFLYITIDNQKIGRINLFNILQALNLIDFLLLYKFEDDFLEIGFGIYKFLTRFKIGLLIVINAESYTTVLRSTGLGLLGSVGRFASAFSPFLAFELYQKDPYLIFFICSIFLVIMLLVMMTYPIDMTQQSLDNAYIQKESLEVFDYLETFEEIDIDSEELLLNEKLEGSQATLLSSEEANINTYEQNDKINTNGDIDNNNKNQSEIQDSQQNINKEDKKDQ